jgi:hypothetical protein
MAFVGWRRKSGGKRLLKLRVYKCEHKTDYSGLLICCATHNNKKL